MLTSGCFSPKNSKTISFIRRLDQQVNDLTYVIGFRAKDGVTVVADRKITRGNGSISYEDKIFNDVPNVLIAAAGPVGLFDKFREQILELTTKNYQVYQDRPSELVKVSEKIVQTLNDEYYERTRSPLELLIGLGQKIIPDLQHVTYTGIGQKVRNYQAMGSGEPYGSFFLKASWSNELNMRQCAALGYYIIKLIEAKELDNSVGVGNGNDPDMWILPVAPDNWNDLSQEERDKNDLQKIKGDELEHIRKIVSNEYLKFDRYFNDEFVNLFHQVQ